LQFMGKLSGTYCHTISLRTSLQPTPCLHYLVPPPRLAMLNTPQSSLKFLRILNLIKKYQLFMSMHYLITSIVLVRFYYVIYVYICHFIVLIHCHCCACAYCAVALFSRFGYKFNNTYLLTKSLETAILS